MLHAAWRYRLPHIFSCQLSKLPPARGAPLGARGDCIACRRSDDPRAHPRLHHTGRAAQSAAAQCLARLGVTVNEAMRSWPPNHSGTARARDAESKSKKSISNGLLSTAAPAPCCHPRLVCMGGGGKGKRRLLMLNLVMLLLAVSHCD